MEVAKGKRRAVTLQFRFAGMSPERIAHGEVPERITQVRIGGVIVLDEAAVVAGGEVKPFVGKAKQHIGAKVKSRCVRYTTGCIGRVTGDLDRIVDRKCSELVSGVIDNLIVSLFSPANVFLEIGSDTYKNFPFLADRILVYQIYRKTEGIDAKISAGVADRIITVIDKPLGIAKIRPIFRINQGGLEHKAGVTKVEFRENASLVTIYLPGLSAGG